MKTQHHPQIGYLDGHRFQRAVVSGCKAIIKHENVLNELNVFPIPDQDTGSNLKRTLTPIVELYPIPDFRINIVSQKMADAAVRSALGYSGIIFSQILLGFAEAMADCHKIHSQNLKTVMTCAVTHAYQSVEEPVEGTILSVLREWSKEITRICTESSDFVQILEISHEKAVSALENTPRQLEILRKNNVVDAGGKALVYFLEGILGFLQAGKLERISSHRISLNEETTHDGAAAPYCVECSIRAHDLNRKGLIEKLSERGRDLIFYGATNFSKFHINTPHPEEVLSCAAVFGEVTSKKIFNYSPNSKDKDKEPFCLVADSTCDLMDEPIENSDVYFVPVKVQVGDKIYTDRWNLIPEEFYRIFDTSPSLPKTSQPSLMDFERVYRHLLAHYRSIISIHLSKALSGTFQTAVQASQRVAPDRITLIDGKNLTIGLGLILLEGFEAKNQGKNLEEVVHRLETASRNTEIFIGLPTLKYLVKGGRVTKTKGVIAKMLNINPILSIGPGGKLIAVSKARGGVKKIEQKIFDLAGQLVKKTSGGFAIAVAHTNAPDVGNRIAERIRNVFGQDAVMVMNASPVLGAHAGPGAFGLALRKDGPHSLSAPDDKMNI